MDVSHHLGKQSPIPRGQRGQPSTQSRHAAELMAKRLFPKFGFESGGVSRKRPGLCPGPAKGRKALGSHPGYKKRGHPSTVCITARKGPSFYNPKSWGSGASGPSGVQGQSLWPFYLPRQAAQLSNPRRSCGRLRLRPMKTMRLVRASLGFQGARKSPSAIMWTAWKAKRRSSLA